MEENVQLNKTSENNRVSAAIGYIPFLFFIPIFANQEDEFAKFHGKQSLVLFCAFIIVWVAIWIINLIFSGILGHIFIIGIVFKWLAWFIHNIIGTIISLGYLVLAVLGIIKAGEGKFWHIPIIGVYADRLKI